MKLKIDSEAYCDKQEIFIGEIIVAIAERLDEHGITGEPLKELTGKIAFDVACMVDGTREIEFDGITANPYLTFLGDNENEIIHSGGNSYTHEIVYGILNAMFKE